MSFAALGEAMRAARRAPEAALNGSTARGASGGQDRQAEELAILRPSLADKDEDIEALEAHLSEVATTTSTSHR